MNKVDELFENGIVFFREFYKNKELESLKESVLDVSEKFFNSGGKEKNNGIHIEHPFKYNDIFLKVISDERVCGIIEEAIGDRITLVNSALDNRQILNNSSKEAQEGSTWHTDSRYIQRGKVRIEFGFGYIAALCLDDFTSKNGATMIIPKSHIFRGKPDREIDPSKYKPISIEAKSGDLFLFDTGLWHSAGKPTFERRWGLFSMYSPWYFKPYFDYTKMFSKDKIKSMNGRLIDLLHFTSSPPEDQIINQHTLITSEKFLSKL